MTYTKIFEHLHQNPELSLEEFETTAFIKKILTEEGIEILDLPLKTGLVARITGSKTGKKIAFRADMDALPLEEKTDLPYKSKNPGKMHACGHDIHMTVGIETAKILNQKKSELCGEVLFVFQPSEENGKGALEVVKTGVLDEVEAIFSLHSSSLSAKSESKKARLRRPLISSKSRFTEEACTEQNRKTAVTRLRRAQRSFQPCRQSFPAT